MKNTDNLYKKIIYLTNYKYTKIFYLIFCISILLATSLYVAYKAAHVHQYNTDQLIDGYLFENYQTFTQAVFPAAHTFLFKWPIFAVLGILGNTKDAFIWITVLTYLTTVAALVGILFAATKNYYVTGMTTLAAASILLLVPVQPEYGIELPVGMAMITTRNIEYIFFIVYLYLIASSSSFRDWRFWTSCAAIIILAASDKLFAMFAVVAFSLGYFLSQAYKLTPSLNNKFWARGLLSALMGFLGATLLPALLALMGIINLDSLTSASPFSFAESIKQMAEGAIFAVEATLVNFGAGIFGKPLSPRALPYLVNGLLLLVGLAWGYRLLKTYHVSKKIDLAKSPWHIVSLLLSYSSAAAYLMFIASDHDYKVDARYLTIAFFALLIASALYISSFVPERIIAKLSLPVLLTFLVVIPIGGLIARQDLHRNIAYYDQERSANTKIVSLLKQEEVSVIAGDYWRLGPIKLQSDKKLTITPVQNCTQPWQVLTSKDWFEPSRGIQKSALLVNVTNSNSGAECSETDIEKIFGSAKNRYLIGINGELTETDPHEWLYIYDYDIRQKIVN